ncbi:MAG: hypothetical protein ACRD4Y_18500 [Candidatus Acidiferrales bacterium]
MATNRRVALKRGFALLGAAVGIGVTTNTPVSAEEAFPETKKGKQMILHARLLRIKSQDLRRGELPQSGMRLLAKAEIVAAASSSRKVGDFFATCFRVNAPGKVADHEPGSLEQHTFVLPEGKIFGTGVGSSGADGEGEFAIIGGTGRYLGARGSYVARQSHLDFGGNGTATFTLTLI